MAILDAEEWLESLVASGIWRKSPPEKCETCPRMIRFIDTPTCWECEFKKKYRHECPECGTEIPKTQKKCIECKSKQMTGNVGVLAI